MTAPQLPPDRRDTRLEDMRQALARETDQAAEVAASEGVSK